MRKRNLHICYIDYSKAFDSVPYNWLIKILEIYKISPSIRGLLAHMMTSWKTTINLNTKAIGTVDIKRGIYQGDSLSPMWFCLALNPLSRMLNNSNAGFRLQARDKVRFNHLLYMNDLKLYTESKPQLKTLIGLTKKFSNTINMSFGSDKCATVKISKGVF